MKVNILAIVILEMALNLLLYVVLHSTIYFRSGQDLMITNNKTNLYI